MLLQAQSLSFLHNPPPLFLSPIPPLQKPNLVSVPSLSTHNQWLSGDAEDLNAVAPAPPVVDDSGPVELPSSVSSIFAISDDPTPLQTATSVLLTGAITVFLFRSIRRRAKRAKELVTYSLTIFLSSLSLFS